MLVAGRYAVMSIATSAETFRRRTPRVTSTNGALPRRTIDAQQITVPGTGVELSRTQAAIAGVALVAALLVATGTVGGNRGGFIIRDI